MAMTDSNWLFWATWKTVISSVNLRNLEKGADLGGGQYVSLDLDMSGLMYLCDIQMLWPSR